MFVGKWVVMETVSEIDNIPVEVMLKGIVNLK